MDAKVFPKDLSIYRRLRRPGKCEKVDFLGRKSGDRISLYKEHFYGNRMLALFFQPKVYKLLKSACFPGIFLFSLRFGRSMYELIENLYKSDTFFTPKINRILFEIFTELEVITILWDFIKYQATAYAVNFDDLWCLFSLSCHQKVIKDIRSHKSSLTIQFWTLLIIDWAMIIGAQFLYLNQKGWKLYFNIGTKFGLIWAHFLYPFLIYDIQIVSLFLAKGYACIGWSMESACRRAKNAEFSAIIDAGWISYNQHLFELLADLTNQFSETKSLFIDIFYLTVTPKAITVIYDIFFTKMKYKLFHFGELVLAILRILIITHYASLIQLNSSGLYKKVYQLSLANNDLGLFQQANMFMRRIKSQEVGLRILSVNIITPSIGPTLLKIVVTYFVTILSFHPVKIYLSNNGTSSH